MEVTTSAEIADIIGIPHAIVLRDIQVGELGYYLLGKDETLETLFILTLAEAMSYFMGIPLEYCLEMVPDEEVSPAGITKEVLLEMIEKDNIFLKVNLK